MPVVKIGIICFSVYLGLLFIFGLFMFSLTVKERWPWAKRKRKTFPQRVGYLISHWSDYYKEE